MFPLATEFPGLGNVTSHFYGVIKLLSCYIHRTAQIRECFTSTEEQPLPTLALNTAGTVKGECDDDAMETVAQFMYISG